MAYFSYLFVHLFAQVSQALQVIQVLQVFQEGLDILGRKVNLEIQEQMDKEVTLFAHASSCN